MALAGAGGTVIAALLVIPSEARDRGRGA